MTISVDGWGDCKNVSCADESADALCPRSVRRLFFFSDSHNVGYMRKHYSLKTMLSWYSAGVLVGCAVLLLSAIAVVQLYSYYCRCCRRKNERGDYWYFT